MAGLGVAGIVVTATIAYEARRLYAKFQAWMANRRMVDETARMARQAQLIADEIGALAARAMSDESDETARRTRQLQMTADEIGTRAARALAAMQVQAVSDTNAPQTPDWLPAFMCPVGQEVMEDPVVPHVAGELTHTYERTSIEMWLQSTDVFGVRNTTDPNTRAPLVRHAMVPNRNLDRAIRWWRTAADPQEGVPEGFKCPITGVLMTDPRILMAGGSAGVSCEHSAIETATDQVTWNGHIWRNARNAATLKNFTLRSAIEEWNDRNHTPVAQAVGSVGTNTTNTTDAQAAQVTQIVDQVEEEFVRRESAAAAAAARRSAARFGGSNTDNAAAAASLPDSTDATEAAKANGASAASAGTEAIAGTAAITGGSRSLAAFACPVSSRTMTDPVIAREMRGPYEVRAVTIERAHYTPPGPAGGTSDTRSTRSTLTPNNNLRRAIEWWARTRDPLGDPPDGFVCPLTGELITDAVTAPSGDSYGRRAMIARIMLARPGTKVSAIDAVLVANTALDHAVDEWRDIKEATERVQRREAREHAIESRAERAESAAVATKAQEAQAAQGAQAAQEAQGAAVAMEPKDVFAMFAMIADPIVAPDGTTHNRPPSGERPAGWPRSLARMVPNNAVLDAKRDWIEWRSHGQSGSLASATCVCPITGAWMVDPVVTADGDSYEREAIEAHFAAQRAAGAAAPVTSPITGRRLQNDALIPNVLLRTIIAAVRALPAVSRRDTLGAAQSQKRYV
jgi:hypothetical protein